LDSERLYVDLLFTVSKKYASWDPEVAVEVGDWGRITTGNTGLAFWRRRRGTFLKEGNIYADGKADELGIPPPTQFGAGATEGMHWIVSQNVQECDVNACIGGQTPAFLHCKAKAGFRVSSGRGAVLVMDNDVITTIDPPGCLRRLLDDQSMRGCIIVSQAHRCSSYARLLTSKGGSNFTIGLSVEPPVSGVVSATADMKWMQSSSAGNFKSKVNKCGNRDYYPLFKLVSLRDEATSSGLRGELEGGDPPLPDAVPPWQRQDDGTDVSGTEEIHIREKFLVRN